MWPPQNEGDPVDGGAGAPLPARAGRPSSQVASRVVDQNWIWRIQSFSPIWIRIQGYVGYNFLKKKCKNNFKGTQFSLKNLFNYKKIPKTFLVSRVYERCIFVFNLTPFATYLSFTGIYLSGSGSAYRTEYLSGSTKVLNQWIQIQFRSGSTTRISPDSPLPCLKWTECDPCSRLSSQRLILSEDYRKGLDTKLRLNVAFEDVSFALMARPEF